MGDGLVVTCEIKLDNTVIDVGSGSMPSCEQALVVLVFAPFGMLSLPPIRILKNRKRDLK